MYNTIWGTLTVKNRINEKVIEIKTEVSDEDDISIVVEELLGVLNYHKEIDFDSCTSEMAINIYVAEGEFPSIEINRVYIDILDKINCKLTFNINENLEYLKYKTDD
ncbi:MAG: hypothetical protein LUG66_08660 [Clostridiales bacterium]|nr:hypothetical protein [Clostridiales bacterium]